jgi:phosphoribosylformylglycinamidine synthase
MTENRGKTMFRSKIRVTLRPSILDPQGKAVGHAIASLGVDTVRDVRMGKYIELTVDGRNEAEARATTEDICRKLLANPVMEDFKYDIEQVQG